MLFSRRKISFFCVFCSKGAPTRPLLFRRVPDKGFCAWARLSLGKLRPPPEPCSRSDLLGWGQVGALLNPNHLSGKLLQKHDTNAYQMISCALMGLTPCCNSQIQSPVYHHAAALWARELKITTHPLPKSEAQALHTERGKCLLPNLMCGNLMQQTCSYTIRVSNFGGHFIQSVI
ncbi:hypothetical protein DFH28DRAFT_289270 [Melampsora americana]|nr:hypothetical protein DFH28DRAFT_289270 [Melampsora americana]